MHCGRRAAAMLPRRETWASYCAALPGVEAVGAGSGVGGGLTSGGPQRLCFGATSLRVCSPLPRAGEGPGERAGAGNSDGGHFVEASALSPNPSPAMRERGAITLGGGKRSRTRQAAAHLQNTSSFK
ncbi:hypothetical protein CBM2637_B100165 [Cupriavidus taiwanensis]|nr:hypothetical protein CBM2637_B100165 [Cupriavidus taiwanensis]